MRVIESEYIKHHQDNIAVKLLTNDLMNVGNTLNWAFPDATLVKGKRGETLLQGECGKLHAILVDFFDGVVYVSEVS